MERCQVCRKEIPNSTDVVIEMREELRSKGRVPQQLLLHAFGLCSERCEDQLALRRLEQQGRAA